MWKWVENPLTSVGDQSGPTLTPTFFASLPYARNRSLDYDLFCRVSSARLPSMSHAHKINSRPGIIIHAALHKLRKYLNSNANFQGTHAFIQSALTHHEEVIRKNLVFQDCEFDPYWAPFVFVSDKPNLMKVCGQTVSVIGNEQVRASSNLRQGCLCLTFVLMPMVKAWTCLRFPVMGKL